MSNYRMIGCKCNEHEASVKFMWLFADQPKRCECGFWFKLEQHDPIDTEKLPV